MMLKVKVIKPAQLATAFLGHARLDFRALGVLWPRRDESPVTGKYFARGKADCCIQLMQQTLVQHPTWRADIMSANQDSRPDSQGGEQIKGMKSDDLGRLLIEDPTLLEAIAAAQGDVSQQLDIEPSAEPTCRCICCAGA
jgi:hypothetical protein